MALAVHKSEAEAANLREQLRASMERRDEVTAGLRDQVAQARDEVSALEAAQKAAAEARKEAARDANKERGKLRSSHAAEVAALSEKLDDAEAAAAARGTDLTLAKRAIRSSEAAAAAAAAAEAATKLEQAALLEKLHALELGNDATTARFERQRESAELHAAAAYVSDSAL